jgi:hypothetical protein
MRIDALLPPAPNGVEEEVRRPQSPLMPMALPAMSDRPKVPTGINIPVAQGSRHRAINDDDDDGTITEEVEDVREPLAPGNTHHATGETMVTGEYRHNPADS